MVSFMSKNMVFTDFSGDCDSRFFISESRQKFKNRRGQKFLNGSLMINLNFQPISPKNVGGDRF